MRLLAAANWLRRGGLLAHQTATLPGIAALPGHPRALARLRRFKQRPGPFLLLHDGSLRARIRLRRWIAWRRRTARRWLHHPPADATLLLPAGGRTPVGAAWRGAIALRRADDPPTLALLGRAGGLLFSSSLNRRGRPPAMIDRHQARRLHRAAIRLLPGPTGSGRPSRIIDLRGRRPRRLR
ncbi:MAG: translation factor [Zetaproteobacteria bacterium]|nr:MAG: translation factor [Zetaproteobacteria bacterium]